MNRTDIRELVREITVVEPDVISDARLNAFINDAINVVASEPGINWPWLETVATIEVEAGEHTYNLPDGVIRIQAVIAPGVGQALTPIELQAGLARAGYNTQPGQPRAYALIGSTKLRLFPTPTKSETYTIVYQAAPTGLSSDTQSPPWHPGFHMAVVEYVCYLVFRNQELETEAGRARGEYFEQIRRMKEFYRNLADTVSWAVGDGGPFIDHWPKVV